jgi:hypothetical protein
MDEPAPADDSPISMARDIACPGCGQTLTVDLTENTRFLCPHCGTEFDVDELADEAARQDAQQRVEDELDGLRIRQLSAERRAIYRQRSFAIVFTAGCAVAGVELIWAAWRSLAAKGFQLQALGYLLVALVAVVGTILFARKTAHINRQLRPPAGAFPMTLPGETPEGPPAEPDFSTLSDGKDRWQNLHDVR